MPGPAYSLCPAVTSVSVCVRGPLRTGHSPAATDRCRYTGTARWSACSGIRHRRPARRRQVPGWTVRSGRRSSACLSAARPPGRRVPAVRGTIPGFSRRVRISSSVSLSFSSWYFLMSKVCCSTSEEVALHTGERIPLIVPSTIVGKNMMQRPSTKGRNRGNTSIGSARARDCHTR